MLVRWPRLSENTLGTWYEIHVGYFQHKRKEKLHQVKTERKGAKEAKLSQNCRTSCCMDGKRQKHEEAAGNAKALVRIPLSATFPSPAPPPRTSHHQQLE